MKNEIKPINKFYLVCGVIICLSAVIEFIIWIVDASKMHSNNQVVLGTGLLAVSVGALLYLLIRPKSYAAANWILWTGIIASIVLFFVGMLITPEAAVLGAI